MQRRAVMTTQGPLLLLAGAGSGKTTVLINRIANLIAFGEASDSNEIPDYVTDEDAEFLEAYLQTGDETMKQRAEALSALHPAAPWSIIAITFNKQGGERTQGAARTLAGAGGPRRLGDDVPLGLLPLLQAGHRPAGGLLVHLHDLRLQRTLSASSRTCCAIFRW